MMLMGSIACDLYVWEVRMLLQKFGGKTNLGHDGVMKSFLIICEHTNMCKMSNYHRNVGAFLRGNATKVTAMTTPSGHLFTHLLKCSSYYQ